MRFVTLRRAAVAALALTGACSFSEPGPNPVPVTPPDASCATDDGGGVPLLGGDCDPMVPAQCGFPFPSNVYLMNDPYTVTGKRVAFGRTTLPGYTPKSHIDPIYFRDCDGFSPAQNILTHLPGATATGLPSQDDLEASLGADSPTILLDADTGERVPHFAEIDESLIGEEPADHAFIIRPVVRLKDATRYIVAIRHVVDVDGKPLAPSETFQALRDGTPSCEPSVGRRRALYDDIFARLEKAGIAKDDLQIAWDYSTASQENNVGRLIRMRDDALAKVGTKGPDYTIASVEENPSPHIRRRVHVLMKVPLYLNQPGPHARMTVDAQGMPIQNGYAEYEVLVHIPHAALEKPGALLQNGHGLLGYKEEGQDGYLAELADKWNYVAFAVDLVGMAHEDFPVLASSAASDIEGFVASVDRQHQGILNSLLAMRMMKGGFATDPVTIIDGKTTIDPNQAFYRGDSQGGIFGTTYMTVTTDVTRGLLGEPGMPYSLLLNRSADFGPYLVLLRGAFRTGRNMQQVIGLLQMLWDRTEPSGYAPYLAKGDLPGNATPPHEVLLHVAIGDHQVTPLGAHMIARAVGAQNLKPVNRSVWGIPEAEGPFMGSGMVEWEFGNKESPKTNTPPDDTYGPDPHDEVRKLPEAMDQTNAFFRTGEVKAFCSGPCNPQ
ncbi:Hypothetical protein A7982_11994 [Minicystis rosea]|nr:Hypothetical protein A7982_11994 [Minicystis rosea]